MTLQVFDISLRPTHGGELLAAMRTEQTSVCLVATAARQTEMFPQMVAVYPAVKLAASSTTNLWIEGHRRKEGRVLGSAGPQVRSCSKVHAVPACACAVQTKQLRRATQHMSDAVSI
jgi:hypothetical protein